MLIFNNRTELVVADDLFELPVSELEKKLDLLMVLSLSVKDLADDLGMNNLVIIGFPKESHTDEIGGRILRERIGFGSQLRDTLEVDGLDVIIGMECTVGKQRVLGMSDIAASDELTSIIEQDPVS